MLGSFHGLGGAAQTVGWAGAVGGHPPCSLLLLSAALRQRSRSPAHLPVPCLPSQSQHCEPSKPVTLEMKTLTHVMEYYSAREMGRGTHLRYDTDKP